MSKIYSFQEQVAISKEYENKIYEYYKTLNDVVKIEDYRTSKTFQGIDVDFVIIKDLGAVIKAESVEVKVDFRMGSTGNLFVEIGDRGWLEKSKAETLLYIDVTKSIGYYINLQELRAFVGEHEDEYQTRDVATSDFGGFTVTGLLLPYNDIASKSWCLATDLTKALL